MTPEELARALATLQPGSHSSLDALDDRELEVFSILSQGYTSRQIESQFGIPGPELRQIKARIQKKLGLASEVELVRAAARHAQENRP